MLEDLCIRKGYKNFKSEYEEKWDDLVFDFFKFLNWKRRY